MHSEEIFDFLHDYRIHTLIRTPHFLTSAALIRLTHKNNAARSDQQVPNVDHEK